MKYKITTKDATEAQIIINAQKYYDALNHINYNIRRNYLKYGDYSESEYDLLSAVFDDITRHLDMEGVQLNLD